MPEIRVIEPIIFAPAEKLRVCAYARVSSDSTDQRNSFASQVNYYTKYIQKKGFLPEDKVWSRKIYQQICTIGKNRLWGMWCYVS